MRRQLIDITEINKKLESRVKILKEEKEEEWDILLSLDGRKRGISFNK